LKIEELQGSLEAHEQRLNERTTERHTDQALQAQTHKRGGSSGRSYNKTRGGYRQYRGGKKRFDKKKLKCFNCGKIGHFSTECHAPTQNQSKGRQDSEANLAKGENVDVEDNTLLLIMTTNTEAENDDTWYLDSGCSNHMTGHK
ncbi:hypothetical protein glysoja_003086, partial [Glycine soja]